MTLPPDATLLADLNATIDAATGVLRQRWADVPRLGLILGTGLGELAANIEPSTCIPYADVPGFAPSTAHGHRGQLVCGELAGVPVIAMQGRCHIYEGQPASLIGLPVRVMHRLGVTTLIVTNAAGAVNPQYRVGDLMVSDDHINLMFANPLSGPHDETTGPRFPDMSRPYDPGLIEVARSAAARNGFTCHRGIYVALTGPNYETRAEYRLVRAIGGDVVGMSTVPEVLTAAQLGLRVVALSTVTNVCLPDALGKTAGEEVARQASRAVDRLGMLLRDVVSAECAT